MIKWDENISNNAEHERIAVRNQQQDEAFRRALLAAVYAGTESCPLNGYHRPD